MQVYRQPGEFAFRSATIEMHPSENKWHDLIASTASMLNRAEPTYFLQSLKCILLRLPAQQAPRFG